MGSVNSHSLLFVFVPPLVSLFILIYDFCYHVLLSSAFHS